MCEILVVYVNDLRVQTWAPIGAHTIFNVGGFKPVHVVL